MGKGSKKAKNPLKKLSLEEVEQYIFDHRRLTTPTAIDKNVLQFCKRLSPNHRPVFLDVQTLSWSRLNFCNKNVEKMIKLSGGDMVLGYRIWYAESLYIEAERHAVWKNPKGQLIDISFSVDGEERILFLPAPNLSTVLTSTMTNPRDAFHPKVASLVKSIEKQEQKFILSSNDSWEGWEQATSFSEWKSQNKCCNRIGLWNLGNIQE